jgi:hypothetical protein
MARALDDPESVTILFSPPIRLHRRDPMDDDKIVSLSEVRDLREMDPDLAIRGDDGKLWFTFGVDFRHEGNTYATSVMAPSWAEAEAMLASLKENGRVYGKIMNRFPA